MDVICAGLHLQTYDLQNSHTAKIKENLTNPLFLLLLFLRGFGGVCLFGVVVVLGSPG